jgi:hypothetical protein
MSARLDSAGVGRILRLLHTLVAYGRNLVETLRQQDDPDDVPGYAFLTSISGTTNPALIIVLIVRGLLRAAALQARLNLSLARVRDSLPSLPLREQSAKPRQPGRGQPRAAGWAIPPGWPAEDPSLDRLPTPEEEMFAEIAAEDRDRPIGAILLDICLDLGIVPALMDPATWDELRLAISLHGGDPTPLTSRWLAPVAPVGRESEAHSATGTPASQPTIIFPPWPALSPQSPAPVCTGPP